MKKLIALLDGSVYATSVCDHAAWVARRTGAAVELLHVLGRHGVSSETSDLSGNIGLGARTALMDELSELDAQQSKLSQKRGRAILEDARDRLAQAGVTDVALKLRHDDILETIEEFETHGDLIVVGKRGEASDFAKMHLGSNLERIVRSSHKPILVASREFKPIESFLLAFDGGTSAFKAVDHIAASDTCKGLDCHLLTVGKDNPDIRRKIDEASQRLSSAGYNVTPEIVPGEPEAVICETSRKHAVGLLVMGAYGHSRIRNLIIGSTTTEMIRSCMTPVMLFR
ncbi:MAG: universal stress protein [Rhodospirillales bacterium]|nr:universal stress protein [Rhodospirillales bacterium]MCW8862114.1 universal stress protein [Rhodospirillales bacterium]MCW8971206.1 universal stress protein [Rhodospirillales bacterium]MCW9003375.1 universal stress protein [Rhodospirillales bacterium]